MRTVQVMMFSMLLASGCREQAEIPDGFCGNMDMRGMQPPDMTPAIPKCSAAKGLAGDNLLCVDFDKITMFNDPALTDWNFSAVNTGGCGGWEIKSGILQLTNYNKLASAGSCGILLPEIDLTANKYNRYNNISLSIFHAIEMDLGTMKPNQLAQIYFGTANPGLLVTETSGAQAEHRLILSFDREKLLESGNNPLRFLLQAIWLTSTGTAGWQISSIAINASQ